MQVEKDWNLVFVSCYHPHALWNLWGVRCRKSRCSARALQIWWKKIKPSV